MMCVHQAVQYMQCSTSRRFSPHLVADASRANFSSHYKYSTVPAINSSLETIPVVKNKLRRTMFWIHVKPVSTVTGFHRIGQHQEHSRVLYHPSLLYRKCTVQYSIRSRDGTRLELGGKTYHTHCHRLEDCFTNHGDLSRGCDRSAKRCNLWPVNRKRDLSPLHTFIGCLNHVAVLASFRYE